MKKKICISFLLLLSLFALPGRAQNNWEHVGPKSENQATDNKFETSRLNNITIDPTDDDHLFASGGYAGLWESEDRGANWLPVDNGFTGANGVSGVAFINSNEILVGDIYPLGKLRYDDHAVGHVYSKKVFKYNFTTQTWQNLGALPNPSGLSFVIRSVAVHPANTSILFVCTSIGLFRSTNGGTSWTNIVADTYAENLVFVPYGTSSYYCYLAGSDLPGNDMNPMGTLMVKQSSDGGATFPVDLSSNFVIPSTHNALSHAQVCAKPVDGSNNVKVFLYTFGKAADPNGLDYGNQYIFSFVKNVSTGVLSSYSAATYGGSEGNADRMGVAYDPVNDVVWYGGRYLCYFKISTTTCTWGVKAGYRSGGTSGYIHDDIHDIQIKPYGGQTEMYVACDGGIVRTVLSTASGSPSVFFNILNNGLHVMLLTGFSGTDDDPDLYAVGGLDIVNLDIYDAATGKNRYTHLGYPGWVWENDGAMIDRFDKNRMFGDLSAYNHYYLTSEDGGATFNSTTKNFWEPSTSSSVFEKGTSITSGGTAGFHYSHYFTQDPYRPDRIFYLKHNRGVFQYVPHPTTPSLSVFVNRISIGSVDPTSGTWGLDPHIIPSTMSFSAISKNGIHFTTDGWGSSIPSVIKYVGNDIDDCWTGHNATFYTDGSGTHPQWALIAGSTEWNSFGISTTEMERMQFRDMETSPWDPNVIYVAVTIPGHGDLQVLKYDGSTWSNYSNGLGTDEIVYSMVMDHQSNDGIYLSTQKGVYYREPSNLIWTAYSTGLPKALCKQMEVNYTENTVRAGSYGRGIYKSNLTCPAIPVSITGCTNCYASTSYFWEGTTVSIDNTTMNLTKQIARATESITVLPGSNFTELNSNSIGSNYYQLYIHGCGPGQGNTFRSTGKDLDVTEDGAFSIFNDVQVYPNPNNGNFTLSSKTDSPKDIYVYNVLGKVVYSQMNTTVHKLEIDISAEPKGLYIIKVMEGNEVQTLKVINQ